MSSWYTKLCAGVLFPLHERLKGDAVPLCACHCDSYNPNFLIDKQGVIRHKHAGPVTPEWVQQTLLPLLKELQRG